MQHYALYRKIHRLLVLVVTAGTLMMSVTGIMLKYPVLGGNLSLMRSLHNQLSVFFTIVLGLMAFSGAMMYFLPILAQRKQNH